MCVVVVRVCSGRKVESVSAMVFTNDMLADMHGASRGVRACERASELAINTF